MKGKGEPLYFIEALARSLVGRRVKTLAVWSGVPRGTTGTVTSAVPADAGQWMVAITWDLPPDPPRAILALDGSNETVTLLQEGNRRVNLVTRYEYYRYLVEIAR